MTEHCVLDLNRFETNGERTFGLEISRYLRCPYYVLTKNRIRKKVDGIQYITSRDIPKDYFEKYDSVFINTANYGGNYDFLRGLNCNPKIVIDTILR